MTEGDGPGVQAESDFAAPVRLVDGGLAQVALDFLFCFLGPTEHRSPTRVARPRGLRPLQALDQLELSRKFNQEKRGA
jgi:hypothetical protein